MNGKFSLLVLFIFFAIEISFSREISMVEIDSWYPNRKIERLYKKNNNVFFVRYGLLYCVALSKTKESIKLYKFRKNKIIKKNEIKNSFQCDFDYGIFEKEIYGNTFECFVLDGDSFSFLLTENDSIKEIGCAASLDCIIPLIENPCLVKIMQLLEDYK